ncbi:uncharacterized protein LOC127122233 [Lathyrus oleraceus]|uniref:uncharacterized protein LOC127122233 n=1 Tax=Pisum sativum TaxID=3888 RepID=UPI0021D1EC40|nr:uncharacterized protein LOC127122233 [Pisum sativum]
MRGKASAGFLFDTEPKRLLRARRRKARLELSEATPIVSESEKEEAVSVHSEDSEALSEPMAEAPPPAAERLLGDYGGTNAPTGRLTIINQPLKVHNFKKKLEVNLRNTGASIKNLEVQMSQIAQQLTDSQTPSALPSVTVTNPREHNNVSAVTTRSGKAKEVPEKDDGQEDQLLEVDLEIKENEVVSEEVTVPKPVVKEKFSESKPVVKLPFPARNKKKEQHEKNFEKFLEMFKKLEINIPFLEGMKIPVKKKDRGSVTIPCTIGDRSFKKALIDLGTSVSLMPLSIYKRLGIGKVQDTRMTLQFADHYVKIPYGVVEDVLVKIDKFVFPVDFVILEMSEDEEIPLILGRPFLETGRCLIDIEEGTMTLKVYDEELKIDRVLSLSISEDTQEVDEKEMEVLTIMAIQPPFKGSRSPRWENLREPQVEEKKDETKKVAELKQLPENLKYVFLDPERKCPTIISSNLEVSQEDKLVKVLKKHKSAMGWAIEDLKGISPTVCMHKILMEDGHKPVVQPQRRLNLVMKEVVRKEVVKLLDVGFIRDFSKIAKPLTILLVKDKAFIFDKECAVAFETIKNKLVTAPIVIAPDWSLPFEIMCDASDIAVGAVLGKHRDKLLHVIYYASHVLNPAQMNYATTEKELLDVVKAFDKFKQYLLGSRVIVYTNHAASKYLFAKQDSKPRLLRWILLLQEFDVEIRDKRGCENTVADHLSRMSPVEENEEKRPIKDEFVDEHILAVIGMPWFYLWDDPFFFKKGVDGLVRRCVPEEEQRDVLKACHDSDYGGHFSGDRTAAKVLQSGLYWLILFKDAQKVIKECDKCQRMGNISKRNQKLQNPMLEVEHFDVWGIDFMGPFPPSFGKNYILVVVDYVSKFGVPRALISDEGTHFLNHLMEKLLLKYNVKHQIATPYHPQTSVQVEVSNRQLKQILEKTVNASRKDWASMLDDALCAYRTAFKTPIGTNMSRRVEKRKNVVESSRPRQRARRTPNEHDIMFENLEHQKRWNGTKKEYYGMLQFRLFNTDMELTVDELGRILKLPIVGPGAVSDTFVPAEFWTAIPAFAADYLGRVGRATSGDISVGGMITQIADHFGFGAALADSPQVPGKTKLDMAALIQQCMIAVKQDYYSLIFQKVHVLALPA